MKMKAKGRNLSNEKTRNEDGSAMIIALLIMVLLMGFVALAITRTNSETVAAANDATESRTFDAANASLEIMTRNFNKIFEVKLNPDPGDFTRIIGQKPPGFEPEYIFQQTIAPTGPAKSVIMKGGEFQGLNAMQDEWQLDTVTTNDATGVEVVLRRRFLNNRIPIFQFGVFYDDDMEFHPGPVFNFGGRVHSNGNIFLMAGSGLYFSSKVSAHYNVFTDVAKNGTAASYWGDNVWVRNASGVFQRVNYDKGSALTSPVNGSPVPNYTTNPVPTAYPNANWPTTSGIYQGNLLANQKDLRLPIKINADINNAQVDLVELVKRGKSVDTAAGTGDLWNDTTGTVLAPNVVPVTATNQDDGITKSERYYNKTGVRVSLADSKAKLPGCVTTSTGTAVTTECGVQLDVLNIAAPWTGVRGYVPRPMTGSPAYQATEVNGERLFTLGKEVWIKIETVQYNATTQTYDTVDITQDILSLGVTEQSLPLTNFHIEASNYPQPGDSAATLRNRADARSIIKLQRFNVSGPWATGNTSIIPTGTTDANRYMLNNANGWTANRTYNYVMPGTVSSGSCLSGTLGLAPFTGGPFPNTLTTNRAHWKDATVGTAGTVECLEAFPINMFDTREGLFNDTNSVFNPTTTYGTNVPWAGVMSMVDIDIANLKRFLDGTFDTNMPTGTPFAIAAGRTLRSTDIPQANGWVFYVSDRRGDRDFDGDYDMEDIFGNNDGTLQLGEDVNSSTTLQADFNNISGAQEAATYTGAGLFAGSFSTATNSGSWVSPGIAAVFEHPFYRRGVRLINGFDLPGFYDTATPSNTRGFTVASENGVYVQGNYNATGIASVGTPTPYTDYLPIGARDVPASVAADAVTVLSNNWSDARSFYSPFTLGNRPASETFARFAMLSGDAITTINATPNQGGGDPRMTGGVHNFKRFLENWGGVRLNYSGSLINLYYARNNNGAFKCCNHTYSPPTRNWVFDATFLDINRIPPGTPFFQSIQITGFQRINN